VGGVTESYRSRESTDKQLGLNLATEKGEKKTQGSSAV